MLKLGIPPSVNVYYCKNRYQVYISDAGRAYRNQVLAECLAQKMPKFGDAAIALHVDIHPATKRKSDLDNRLKSLCDSLMHAGIFEDDSQIDEILIRRKQIIKYGLCVVTIERLDDVVYGQNS